MSFKKLTLAAFISTSLVGCGGGSGGDSVTPEIKPPIETPEPPVEPELPEPPVEPELPEPPVEPEIVIPTYDIDQAACEERASDVSNAEFYYCSTNNTADINTATALAINKAGNTFTKCENTRLAATGVKHINAVCIAGEKRDVKIDLGNIQAKLNTISARFATTLPECTVENEYLNVDMDDNYELKACSPIIIDKPDYKVRNIRKIGDNYFVSASYVSGDEFGNSIQYLKIDTFVVKADGSSSSFVAEHAEYLGSDPSADEIKTVTKRATEVVKASVDLLYAPKSQFNNTNDIVMHENIYGSDSTPIDRMTFINTDTLATRVVDLEKTDVSGFGNWLIGNELILATSSDGAELTRGWRTTSGENVRVKYRKGTALAGFNDAGNMVIARKQLIPDDMYNSTILISEEHNPYGEFIKELDRNNSNFYQSSTPHNFKFSVNEQYIIAHNYFIDVKTGKIAKTEACVDTTGESNGYYSLYAIHEVKNAAVCTTNGGSNFGEGFLRHNFENGIEGSEPSFIKYQTPDMLQVFGTVDNNLRAGDEFGGKYIISSKTGAVLTEQHLDDVIRK
ncbi:hypothetical protein [Photobacterium leiognathi]|uniref:hypothetical protein n=1 Tax=Photobacterium leiognathi TaxID=553611 RepID=UPI00298209B4|nr:hypothetical protein [Photobacterium leiognathi]